MAWTHSRKRIAELEAQREDLRAAMAPLFHKAGTRAYRQSDDDELGRLIVAEDRLNEEIAAQYFGLWKRQRAQELKN